MNVSVCDTFNKTNELNDIFIVSYHFKVAQNVKGYVE